MRHRYIMATTALWVAFVGCASDSAETSALPMYGDATSSADTCAGGCSDGSDSPDVLDAPDVLDTPNDASGPEDALDAVAPSDGHDPDGISVDAHEADTATADAENPADTEDPAGPDATADDAVGAPDAIADVGSGDDAGGPDILEADDTVDSDVGGGDQPEPVLPSPGEPTVASAQLLGTGVVQATIVGDAVLAVGEAGATWVGAGPPTVVDPLLNAAVGGGALDATHVFLADSAASWLVDATSAEPSPIADALGGDISGVAIRPGASPTLWLAAQAKLWRWRDAQLTPLLTPGYDFSEARLALDDTTLWAASPFGLYRVTETPGGADVFAEKPELDAVTVAVDSAGVVAVVDSEGDLHLRGDDGWKAWRFPVPARSVCGNWIAGRLFVVLNDGAVWFVSGEDHWPIATAGSGFEDCVVDASGRGVTLGPGGLTRWAVNAPIDVGPAEITWTAEVGPLIAARCNKCHGPSGYAHPLNSYDQAKNEIDSLLIMVSSGAMPLPPNAPLSGAEVALIQAWKSGGFLK